MEKVGRREEETSERGNFETRGGREEIEEKWFTLYVANLIIWLQWFELG